MVISTEEYYLDGKVWKFLPEIFLGGEGGLFFDGEYSLGGKVREVFFERGGMGKGMGP